MGERRIDGAHDLRRMARFRRLAEARERIAGGPATPRNARASVLPSFLAERRYRKAFYDVLFAATPFTAPLAPASDEGAAG